MGGEWDGDGGGDGGPGALVMHGWARVGGDGWGGDGRLRGDAWWGWGPG